MKDLIEHQLAFDKTHGWSWEKLPLDVRMQKLQYALIALQEELGEIAGPTKKLLRKTEGKVTEDDFAQLKGKISEEVVDVLIYTIKLATLLELDLEKAYFEKMERNETRFESFRKA